jgi:hypothetical protein
MEKLDSFYTVVGNVKCYWHYGKEFGGSSKIQKRIIVWSSSPTSGYIPNRIKIRI